MQTIYISIQQLELRLARTPILRGITCDIPKGETIAIVGTNGSGKSTLLKLICGLLKPSSGEIRINDLSFKNSRDYQQLRTLIGYAPDNPPLYAVDTVYNYLKFIAELKQVSKKTIKQRIDDCLEVFDLTDCHNKIIASLSKGTQQRINLAQAVIHQPQLLILDEPTNGLDAQQCENFAVYLKMLQLQKVTTLIASHHYTEIIKVCDYMLKIQHGKLQKIMLPTTETKVNIVYDHLNYTS
jgi:ABC-2 type transport system ATP-binding protein